MRPFLAPTPDRPVEPADSAPTFSVIVAAYQVADVVSDALESLRRQTAPPHEIILCDDGSTDALEDALAPYRDEIVFVRKTHGGEASAKNAAAVRATGDFVVILDADDAFLPTRLEALAELAQNRPDLDILTTDAYLVVDGRPVRRNYGRRWRFEVADQRRAILQRNFVFGHAAVRRQRMLEHQGFDESILWTLDKAAQSNLLEPGERAVVERTIMAHRREVDMIDVRAAAMAGNQSVRGRALAAARGGGSSLRQRLEFRRRHTRHFDRFRLA